MSDFWLKTAFLLGIVAQIVIRSPYTRLLQQNRVTTDRSQCRKCCCCGCFCWAWSFR